MLDKTARTIQARSDPSNAGWSRGELIPIIFRETTAELLRVLLYPKFKLTQAERETLLGDYLPFVEVVLLLAPLPEMPVSCRDREDMVFIQLALASNADMLVSGDGNLAVLREIVPVPMATVDEFQALLSPR